MTLARRFTALAVLALALPRPAPAAGTLLDHGQRPGAWAPGTDESAPPRLHREDGVKALRFDLPFSRLRGWRFSWDRAGAWDLSRAERLVLRARSGGGAAQAVLYFRSGDGWYRLPPVTLGTRWRDVELDRSQAQAEGSPEGWGQISGLRLSVLPGVNGDTWLDLARLESQHGLHDESVWEAGNAKGKEAVFRLILDRASGQAYTDARHRLSAADGVLTKAAVHRLEGAARRRALRDAHRRVDEAYALAMPPHPPAFRGAWVQTGDGTRARSGDRALHWKEAVPEMAAQGFNAVLAGLQWPSAAYYPSQVLPAVPGVAKEGDYLQELLDAAKPLGLQVYARAVLWRLADGWEAPVATPAGMAAAADFSRDGRLQRDATGAELPWLCPCDERNRQLELDALTELAQRYPVDGVVLDSVRFASPQAGFGPACRARFEAFTGKAVAQWPQDCAPGGIQAQEYGLFKREIISSFVRDASQALRRARPGMVISVAVHPDMEAARKQVSQDWVRWAESGWVDRVFPMTYTQDPASFEAATRAQAGQVGAAKLVPCVQAVLENGRSVPLGKVAAEAAAAAALHTQGVALVEWREQLQDSLLPFLHNGLWREGPYNLVFRAIPPGQAAPVVTPGRKPKGLPAVLRVDDFESGDLHNALGGVWTAMQDGADLGTRLINVPLAPSEPGANGSSFGLALKGHIGVSKAPWPWASLNTSLDPDQRPFDLSDYHQLAFNLRGDGKPVQVLFKRASVRDGGEMRGAVRSSADWTAVRIDLADLAQPDWAEPVEPSLEDVTALAFQPGSRDDEDFWFEIDDVRLLR